MKVRKLFAILLCSSLILGMSFVVTFADESEQKNSNGFVETAAIDNSTVALPDETRQEVITEGVINVKTEECSTISNERGLASTNSDTSFDELKLEMIESGVLDSVSNDSMNAVNLLSTSSGSSMESASIINLSQNYSGTISVNQSKNFYQFSIDSSGRLSLQATAYMEWIYYRIYDSDGNQLWSINPSWNSTTETISTNEKIDLTKGTYYFVVEKDGNWTGNYNFALIFNSANESFTESGNGSNNSISSASAAYVNKKYNAQIAINDNKDFFRFYVASSGRITFKATAYMEWIYYRIYDLDGNQLWSINPSWNSTTKAISTNEKIDLIKGTYYLVAEKDGNRTGNYKFELDYNSANESFTESGIGNNNTMSVAKSIKVNTVYTGQIAINDDRDFYKFNMTSSGRLTLNGTAYLEWIYYRLYDDDGNQLWSRNPLWNSDVKKSTVSEGIDLSKGTYYFAVERDGNCTGNYSFQVVVPQKQPMTVKSKTVTVKKSALKKASKSIAKSKAFTISNAKGTVFFKKTSGSKKVTISSTGKITVKKGTAKGTYKIKVKVTAAGNNQYKVGSKTVTVTIKVK